MFKTFADSNNILALTELTRTGDYKNAENIWLNHIEDAILTPHKKDIKT